jgi:hypothetical protein
MNNYANDTTYDIMCPFCFKRYSNHRALFVDHKVLTDEVYPEYAEYMRAFLGIEEFSSRKMPTLFKKEAGGGVDSPFAAATSSGDIAYARACPFCCNVLPAAAGRVKPFSIAVIGADDGERGYYLASVLHRLGKELSEKFGASFLPADFKTAQTFFEQYEEPLYAEGYVPEAMPAVTPLIYEYCRIGATVSEEWVGNSVTYNRAVIYIYNIDKDLCDRYPMVADSAVSQASGIILLSDIYGMASSREPLNDPWLGHLNELFRRLFGVSSIDKPSAIVLTNADRAALADRKWSAVIKAGENRKIEKKFPLSYYTKQSAKAVNILRTRLPAYYTALSALFSPETTAYFPAKTFYELRDDGKADIKDNHTDSVSFGWLLSKLGVLPDDSSASFRMKK